MATSSTRSSIVRRLTTRAALWAALFALTLGGVSLWQYWRVSLRTLDARLLEEATLVARAITVQEGQLEVDVPADVRASLSADASYYAVEDHEGRVIDGDDFGGGVFQGQTGVQVFRCSGIQGLGRALLNT